MKKFLALMLAFVLIFTVACSGGSSGGNTDTSDTTTDTGNTADSSGGNTSTDNGSDTAAATISGDLVVWMDQDSFAEAVIAGFNAKYPDVNIQYELVGLDASAKLSLDGPAGIGPDVLTLQDGAITNAIVDGNLEPYPAALQALVEDTLLETPVSVGTYNGVLYGVPITIEHISLYYNKDLIDTPATTIEEIIEFAASYNDPAADKYAMRWPTGDGFHAMAFTSTFGYRPFGPDGTDWQNPGFDSPEMTAGLDFIVDNLRAVFDYTAQDAGWEGVVVPFQRGDAPYCITGPWAAPGAMEAGLNFGTAKLPTIGGVQPYVFSASRLISVSSYTKNPDAAFAFAEYMASEEVAGYVYSVFGALPALKDPSVIAGFSEDEVMLGMAAQAPYTIPALNIPEAMYIWEPWTELHTFAWEGLLSIEDSQQKAMETYELLLNAAGLSIYD